MEGEVRLLAVLAIGPCVGAYNDICLTGMKSPGEDAEAEREVQRSGVEVYKQAGTDWSQGILESIKASERVG